MAGEQRAAVRGIQPAAGALGRGGVAVLMARDALTFPLLCVAGLLLGCAIPIFEGASTAALPQAVEEPSLAAAAWAAAGGAAVLRVHDVGATRKFLAAWTAIDSAGTGGPA